MWLRRVCALLVTAVVAYSSFEHGRGFAQRRWFRPTDAIRRPLSVDGLLLLLAHRSRSLQHADTQPAMPATKPTVPAAKRDGEIAAETGR